MVHDLRDRVDLWLQRTEKDMKSFDGQGYIYGLRMFTAFARVLKHCLLAHKEDLDSSSQVASTSAPDPAHAPALASVPDSSSETKDLGSGASARAGAGTEAQQEQDEKICLQLGLVASAKAGAEADARHERDEEICLSMRNDVAQNRCRCEECVRLKQSNKLHLASLPIWLCKKYHDERLKLHPDVEKRKEKLIKLFDGFPSKPLPAKDDRTFTAHLFCVWPHCKNYELKRYEHKVTSHVEPANTYTAVKTFLDEHRDLKNNDYMVVKIDVSRHGEVSVFDVIVVVRSAAAQVAAEGSSMDDYDGLLSIHKHIADDDKQDKESMLEAFGEDKGQLNERCSPKVSEVNKLCLLLKILMQSVTRQNKKSADLANFDLPINLNILFSTIVQKFCARAQDGGNIETLLKRKLVELSDGCVECFRDECISFMSDLRHVVSSDNDYTHYSKCQDTIAQFVGNIKIDLSLMDSLTQKCAQKNDGVESAIIQR
jgi:hypothetical protein